MTGAAVQHIDWPLVGRADELASACALQQQVAGGVGGCLLISAVAGAGKSFLLSEIGRMARGAGAQVRVASARGGMAPPYSLVTDAFGHPASIVAASGPRSFFEAGISNVADALAIDRLLDHVDADAMHAPLLAVLDDVHLADPGSLQFIAAMLPRLATVPVGLVLAGRPPAPGSALAALWPQLERYGQVLPLAPLGSDELSVLCTARFGAPPGPRLVASLEATGGLPLLAATTLEAIPAHEVVVADGLAEIDASTAASISRAVPDPVRSRMEAVVGADGAFAAAAAVAGQQFDLGDVAAVLQVPLRDAVDAVGRLESAGVVVASDLAFRFRHEHYRLAAEGLVAVPVRVALHRGYADLLAGRGESPLAIADHLVAASVTGDQAASWLTQAASLLVPFDPAAALGLADRAVAVGNRHDRVLAVVRLRALSSMGRVEESDALARALLADLAAQPDAAQEEITLRRELALGLFQLGRPAESIPEISRAEALETDPRRRWRLTAERAFMHLLAGDFSVARSVAAEASTAGEALGDITTRLAADMAGGLVTLYVMDLDEAEQMAQRLVRLAQLPEAAEATFYQPWFAASIIRLELGEFAEARRINGIGRARSGAAGYAWIVPGYDTLDAAAHFQEGNLDDTEAAAGAAVAAAVADSFGVNLWCHALLARCAALRDDWPLAEHHLAQALGEVRDGQAQFGRDHLAIAQSAVMEHAGDMDGAYANVRDYWEAFSLFAIDSPRQELSLHVVRLGLAVGDTAQVTRAVEHLAQVAERSGRERFAADHAYAAAMAVGDSAGEAAALERLVALGFRLRELCARGLHPVSRPPTRPGLGRLSKSERAVVGLLSEGLSNAQIGERLFVSRRTVESHVSSAYRKLGVTNRVELARRALD